MPRIFISYRRDDTAPYAGRLFADLADHVQRGDLIMDIDSIAPGEHFGQFIRDEVGSCDVLLALIGKRWLTIRDSRRRRRLDDPEDFVRIEIGTALARDIRVVPVLLGGARVPNPARLPPDLQALSQRQAVEITDERWNYDVGRLIEALDATVNPVPRPPLDAQPDTRLRLVRDTRVISAGVVTLTLAAVALVWQVLQWADPGTGVRTDGQPTTATRAAEVPSPPSLAVGGTTEVAASPSPVPVAVAATLVSTPSPAPRALASPAPNTSATAAKAAPTCTTALSPDGLFTYNPDTAAKLQSVDWSAAGASTLWALRSIGCEVAEEDLYDLMVPRYITREVGLLDGSGAGLARLLSVDLGLRAQSQRPVTFDELVARAGSEPIIMGTQRWASFAGHWVAVRRFEDGALVLMNPAESDPRFGQVTLDREAFNARAPVSAVWIEMPSPPTPTPRPPTPTPTPRRVF